MEHQERLFFEATEQRIKAWAARNEENLAAFWRGDAPPHDPQELTTKRASILQEMDYPERLEAALEDPSLPPPDRRRLELHQLWMVETAFRTHPEMARVEDRIRRAMREFAPTINGSPVTWAQVDFTLRTDSDRERREAAWKAQEPLALKLERDMGELLALREAWARSLTGGGFAPVAYHVQQLERTFVVNLLDEVERTTRGAMPAILERLARAAEAPDLEPWDYFFGMNALFPLSQGAFSQSLFVDAAELQARRWGWEPTEFDLSWTPADHPGRPHVFGGPQGVTLVCRAGDGPWGLDRFLRSYGQGIHRLHAGGNRYFLETPAGTQLETTGCLFAHVLMEPEWLEEHTGAGAKEVDSAIEQIRAYHLLKMRFHLAHNAFENVAYTHADVEPTRLFHDVLEQVFQGTRQRSTAWAAMGSYLETPLSHAKPILGTIVAAQLWNALEQDTPHVWRSEQVGKHLLNEWIAPGAGKAWEDALNRITSEMVNLDGFRKWYKLQLFEGPRPEESEPVSDADAEAYFKGIDLSDLD